MFLTPGFASDFFDAEPSQHKNSSNQWLSMAETDSPFAKAKCTVIPVQGGLSYLSWE